jgi:hypothetical protein
VFPVRYELNVYILFRRKSDFMRLIKYSGDFLSLFATKLAQRSCINELT